MQVLGPDRQYCPQQEHDGVWSEGVRQSATRNLWPMQWFDRAVAEYTGVTTKAAAEPSALPELDITLEV